jgi:hypothetical protein
MVSDHYSVTIGIKILTNNLEPGMFLFAKLVMENFFSQTKRENLTKELEPNRFPRGLEEAYVLSPFQPV